MATLLNGTTRLPRPDAVVISHLHLDHVYDLLPLGRALLAGALTAASGLTLPDPLPVSAPIPVLAPRGATALLTALAGLFPLAGVPDLERVVELALPVTESEPDTTVSLPLPRGRVELDLVALRHAPHLRRADPVPRRDPRLLRRHLPHRSARDARPRHRPAARRGDRGRTRPRHPRPPLRRPFDARWLRWCWQEAAAHFTGPVGVARPLDTLEVGRAM